MGQIPATPLKLGLAGLLPFVWGALTVLNPGLADWTRTAIGPRFAGPYVLVFYGAVILSFMSGVLWGFATRMPERGARGWAMRSASFPRSGCSLPPAAGPSVPGWR